MPHVIVKLWPGKSEQQKARLAEALTKDVMEILHYGDESVSVALEEVKPRDWVEKVCRPDILTSGTPFTKSRAMTRVISNARSTKNAKTIRWGQEIDRRLFPEAG